MKTKIVNSDLKDKSNKKSNKSEKIIIVDIIVIIISLAILVMSVFIFLEWRNEKERDRQREVEVGKIQEGLEKYYNTYGSYPEGVVGEWEAMVREPKMSPFYNFKEFKDPCQPEETVSKNGIVVCKLREVKYIYQLWSCGESCQKYKIILYYESGGIKEFFPD